MAEITQEEFDIVLQEIIVENVGALLTVPGVYELLSEEFNSAVVERLKLNNQSLARCPSCGIPTIPDHVGLEEEEMMCDMCYQLEMEDANGEVDI